MTYTGTMKHLCKFKQLLSLILLARLFAWARVLFFKTTPVSNLYSCEKVHGSGITYMIGLRGIPYVKNFKRMGYILQKLPPYFPIKMLHIQTLLLDTRDKHLSCLSWWIYKIEFVREKNTDKTIWFLIQQKKNRKHIFAFSCYVRGCSPSSEEMSLSSTCTSSRTLASLIDQQGQ